MGETNTIHDTKFTVDNVVDRAPILEILVPRSERTWTMEVVLTHRPECCLFGTLLFALPLEEERPR